MNFGDKKIACRIGQKEEKGSKWEKKNCTTCYNRKKTRSVLILLSSRQISHFGKLLAVRCIFSVENIIPL